MSSRMQSHSPVHRFTKFASREVVGGTVYEKFAHFDQLIQKEHFRTTYKRLKEKYAHWVSVFSDDKDNPIKCVSVPSATTFSPYSHLS